MHQPRVSTPFPGPKAREILTLDRKFMSQSMTRLYPIVAEQGCGCWISDLCPTDSRSAPDLHLATVRRRSESTCV